MFAKLMAWIRGELTTVDNVMADFATKITKLESVAKAHLAKSVTHAEEIAAATESKLAADAEVLKASATAAKLKTLLG